MRDVAGEGVRVPYGGGDSVDRRAQAGGRGREHHLGPCVCQREVVVVRDTEVGGEVHVAEGEAHHARLLGHLVGAQHPARRFDECDERAAAGRPCRDLRKGRRILGLGNHHRAAVLRRHGQVGLGPGSSGGVDPYDRPVARGQPGCDVGARLVLVCRGDRVLQVDDDQVGAGVVGLGVTVGAVAGDEEEAPRGGDRLAAVGGVGCVGGLGHVRHTKVTFAEACRASRWVATPSWAPRPSSVGVPVANRCSPAKTGRCRR